MTKTIYTCVNCESRGLSCRGAGCVNNAPREILVCDECEGKGPIYEFEGRELCGDCLSEFFGKDLEDILAEEDVEEIKR